MPRTGRSVGATVLGAACLLALTGCPAEPVEQVDNQDPTAEGMQVRASLIQYRSHTNTREISVHITSHELDTLHVVGVRLLSPGLEEVEPTPTDVTYVRGQTIDLAAEYGRPLCAGELDGEANPLSVELTVEVDSATTTETVDITDAGAASLGRLVDTECALVALSRRVEVDYVGGFSRAVAEDGSQVLRGALRFARPPGTIPDKTVTVSLLDGSVLLIFRPVDGSTPGQPLVRLGPTERSELLPVEMTSTGRCSGHELGESKQTFLLGVFVRRAGDPLQRVIVKPSPRQQLQGLRLISDICGTPPPG